MARPRIGIFGVLVAAGSVIAWRWAQRRRASQARLAGELSRWEEEGGSLVSAAHGAKAGAQAAQRAPAAQVSPHAVPNGHAHVGGTRDAWHFPHS